MKKIFTILLIFSSLGIASATDYPEKINNSHVLKKFNNIKKFRGIYERIYKDANNEDLVEVCERTLRWPKFWKKNRDGQNELFYSVKNCQQLNGKSSLSEFLHLENKNMKDFNEFEDYFSNKFNYERELLRNENDWRRKTGLAYIFSDGLNKNHNSPSGTRNNSPFDIVSDLNQIDEIFFGEKHTKPEFMFTKNPAKKLTESLPEDSDVWLEQTEDNLDPEDPEFNKTEESLSGILWQLGIKVFRENLNTYDLAAAKVQKTALDSPFANGIAQGSGFTAKVSTIPPESNDQPESLGLDKLLYNPLPTLNAFVIDYILVQSSYKDKSDLSINEKLKNVIFSDKTKKELVEIDLQNFKRDNSRESENANFTRMSLNFSQLTQTFAIFSEKINILNEDVFPYFLGPDNIRLPN